MEAKIFYSCLLSWGVMILLIKSIWRDSTNKYILILIGVWGIINFISTISILLYLIWS